MANDGDTIVVNTQPRSKKGGGEEKMAQGKVSRIHIFWVTGVATS